MMNESKIKNRVYDLIDKHISDVSYDMCNSAADDISIFIHTLVRDAFEAGQGQMNAKIIAEKLKAENIPNSGEMEIAGMKTVEDFLQMIQKYM